MQTIILAALAGIPAWLRWLLLAIAIVLAASWYGYRAGQNAERQATLKASIEALRTRKQVNEQTRTLDDAGLCRALGGVPDATGNCL